MIYRFTVQEQTLAKLTFDAKSRKLSWANINSVRELIVASKMVTCKSEASSSFTLIDDKVL